MTFDSTACMKWFMMHWVAQGNQRAFDFMFGGGILSWDK